jgi:hypothetical protein
MVRKPLWVVCHEYRRSTRRKFHGHSCENLRSLREACHIMQNGHMIALALHAGLIEELERHIAALNARIEELLHVVERTYCWLRHVDRTPVLTRRKAKGARDWFDRLRRANPTPYLGARGGEIPPRDSSLGCR